ncbi:MAG: iron-containing alcohol dehydrogenase [Paludibacteraceae bacterium]|nr:iron-containing alcohol dehydrogenase [Paludibacteraceae bacterium]
MNIFRRIYCRAFQAAFHVAIPFLPYHYPEIYNSLEDIPVILKKRGINTVLFVTDQGLVKAGLAKMVEDVLTKAGITFRTYSDTVPNPTITNVESARQLYVDIHAQAFIALGGGSAMDCAKAAAARIARPNKTIPQMRGILKVHHKLPPVIAIPTTAGTGSETTVAAIVTDSRQQYKYMVSDFCLIPPYAIHDYRLTVGLPKHITATTGMDALTHAVEAYIGGSTVRETRQAAEEATRLIHAYLYRAYQDGNDAEARQQMLKASYYAGIAFSKSYVGYVHAVAHSLGGKYGTPHGLANSVLLPRVLRYYGKAAHKRLAQLARRSGVIQPGMSDAQTANLFIDWIQEMNDKMGIPHTITELREADIPEMAAHADAEGNPLYPVPVLLNKRELKELYKLVVA